jgi:hypothetical protein
MPKIKKPPPKGILEHLIRRYHEGRIQSSDLLELKQWMESEPTVPDGDWFKRFKTGTLTGHGEKVATFLSPGMAVQGEEVK